MGLAIMVYATTELTVGDGVILGKIESWAVDTLHIPTSVGSAKTSACSIAKTAIKKEIDTDLAAASGGTTRSSLGSQASSERIQSGTQRTRFWTQSCPRLGAKFQERTSRR